MLVVGVEVVTANPLLAVAAGLAIVAVAEEVDDACGCISTEGGSESATADVAGVGETDEGVAEIDDGVAGQSTPVVARAFVPPQTNRIINQTSILELLN